MRRTRWFFSGVLFCVSLSFLLFSKHFFSGASAPSVISLPAVTAGRTGVVLLANEQYYPYLKQSIRKAQHSITGTVFLFRTARFRDNEPADLLEELIAAGKRKVRVSLVMELSDESQDYNEANLEAARLLRKGGVTVRLDSARVTTHAKVFVIDNRYCFLGSHNFTHAAMAMNKELSVMIDSPDLAKQITQFIGRIPLSADQ